MDALSSVSADEQPHDRVQVAVTDTCGFAQVLGRGSYKVSSSLKQFAGHMLDEGRTALVVDVSHCEGMDSTFMGVMAGISQRLQKAGGDPVVMTGVSGKLRNLMQTLGLNRLVRIQSESWSQPRGEMQELETGGETGLESAEHILEAHEKLVEIDEANLPKFEDVLEFLREDVRRQQG